MKRKIFTIIIVALWSNLFAQNRLKVNVVDASNQKEIPGALVVLQNTEKIFAQNTDEFGSCEFRKISSGTYSLKVRYIGYDEFSTSFILQKDSSLLVELKLNDVNELDKIIVNATRAKYNAPISFINIDKEIIERRNNAQDVPLLLKNMPSVITTTDAGNGVGYTGMWIRGTDITRINVTINGIPLNDPESQGVFWVDVPNLLDVTDNIQIQRGVGSSTLGAGAFGASINIRTNRINTKPYVDLNTVVGSFATAKQSLGVGTGLLNDKAVFEARATRTTSDGYIDNAWSKLHSLYFSTSFLAKNTMLKLSYFKGFEETYQAWAGVPKDSLKTNRTFNPYTYENEIDHYEQSHYNMHIVSKLVDNLYINITPFAILGEGYYEQFKENHKLSKYGLNPIIIGSETITRTDLIRRKWLDNFFVGVNYSLSYSLKKLNIVFGGQSNYYDGSHFGEIIWMKFAGETPYKFRWYESSGIKKDYNNFVKVDYKFFDRLNLFADLQYRIVNYTIEGKDDDLSLLDIHRNYKFFNPKGGIVYDINKTISIFGSVSVANREPKRSDFTDAPDDKMPRPEKMIDFEAGVKFDFADKYLELNFYNMDYKDQLILTGEINDVGAPIVTNVPRSFRRGLEVIGAIKLSRWLNWSANATFSQNKILNFVEYVDDWDTYTQVKNQLGTTDISFSPNFIANNSLTFKPLKNIEIDFTSKYVSRVYLDNTSSIERSLDPYFVSDLSFRYTILDKFFSNTTLMLQIFNLFNEDYITNAWVYSYYSGGQRYFDAGYFPQAFRHYMLTLNVKF